MLKNQKMGQPLINKNKLEEFFKSGKNKEDACKHFNVSRGSIHRYCKKYNLNVINETRICILCKNKFITKINTNAKYCSSKCRNKHWIILHPKEHAKYQKKYNQKIVVQCRYCKQNIPNNQRASGVTYCSNKCRKESRKIQSKNLQKQISNAFADFKIQLSCANCKYNKCAASLDFHHVIEHKKERRITASMWYWQSKLIKQELDKCILLCKNCHYEAHSGLIEISGTPRKWLIKNQKTQSNDINIIESNVGQCGCGHCSGDK